MTDKTREADLALLRRLWPHAGPVERRMIESCADKIIHEDKYVKMMRESLVKAHRKLDHDEIKDIHEYISNKPKYLNAR
jgi:hypothetical protein